MARGEGPEENEMVPEKEDESITSRPSPTISVR